MSIAYDEYLNEHVGAVKKGWMWMEENLLTRLRDYISANYKKDEFDPMDSAMEVRNLIDAHDLSKIAPDEYYFYDDYFYGGNRSHEVVENFHRAFLNHLHRNPHHWQYWVLPSDNAGEPERYIEIPLAYIFEMICDWWSFSWRAGDLTTIFKWWDEHKDHIRMHKKSRRTVEKVLSEMKKELTVEESDVAEAEGPKEETVSHSDAKPILLDKKMNVLKEEDDKKFGVPELKKYPMPDADHVRSAIRFFNYISPEYEKELAEAILDRMKEYNLTFDDIGVGDENKFKKYIPVEHSGIKGMHWGVKNGPPYPIKDGEHSSEEQKELGLKNFEKAKVANLESWGKDEDHNVLYIAGYSGSGKSTTALALANSDDTVIHLDAYTEKDDDGGYSKLRSKDFTDYLDKHIDKWETVYQSNKEGDNGYPVRHSPEYWKKVDEFDKAIQSYAKEQYQKGNKVIVEGVQIADGWLAPLADYKDRPVVILQNGPIKSLKRAFERDDRGGLLEGLGGLKSAKEYATWYYNMSKNLDVLAEMSKAEKRKKAES